MKQDLVKDLFARPSVKNVTGARSHKIVDTSASEFSGAYFQACMLRKLWPND